MAESIQKRLTRERPPRVKITYDVETGNAIVKTELPFVMGVIADLSGERANMDRSAKTVLRNGVETALPVNWRDYPERAFVLVDKDNFNEVLADFAPRLPYKPSDAFRDELEARAIPLASESETIVFNNLGDFTPDNLVDNISSLNGALAERNLVRDIYTKMDTNEELLRTCFCHITDIKMNTVDENRKPVQVAMTSETANAAIAKAFKNSPVADLAAGYFVRRKDGLAKSLFPEGSAKPEDDGDVNARNLIKILIAEVAAIDGLIGREMDCILHDPDFQSLEAAWRGLFYLVRNSATGTGLKLKVLNANIDELYKDLTEALDFDQSRLFKMVYEETYGTQGGEPYTCLLHAHYYGKDDRSMELVSQMTSVAAAAHAPLLTAPSPDLFDLDSFKDLAAPRDLAKIFENAEHIKWKSLRETEDSRYLAMCLPRTLMRAPYAKDDVESFEYEEMVGTKVGEGETAGVDATNPDHDKYLWGNAAYALGTRITNAFELYGWTAAIRGMEGGGLVEELPLHNYTRASGDTVTKIPTETAITDRREKELSDLGFISLCYRLGTDKAVFFGGQTVNKPVKYLEADATANANLSARLPYILNASRFAHYVKSIMRDKVGSFLDRESVESFLNNWMSAYVLLSDNATQNIKASYPLREGRVDVTADESNPGVYSAIMYLRPHYQLEELSVSIRLVATLPAPAA